ncbi:MAG: hypothetical protein RQ856_03670 [Candidatus Izemoplasmatales bacterium]|nr:hypothetical protein [Candidatus Izemoplasmatales bacterium]
MEIFKYNQARVKKINKFMKDLLEAKDTSKKVKLYKEYEDEIANLNPLDIFYLDFYSDNTKLSITEIKDSANKFVNVFHKGINNQTDLGDHILFKELLEENKRIQRHLALIKTYYKREVITKHKKELLKIFNQCLQFDKKFNKYENVIFPNLENKIPSNKPLEVLWELHDDSKDLLKKIIMLL